MFRKPSFLDPNSPLLPCTFIVLGRTHSCAAKRVRYNSSNTSPCGHENLRPDLRRKPHVALHKWVRERAGCETAVGRCVETRRIVWRLKAQRLPHAQRDSPFTRRVWKVIPLGSSPRRATRCPALGNHEASIANALETTARPHTSRMVVVKPWRWDTFCYRPTEGSTTGENPGLFILRIRLDMLLATLNHASSRSVFSVKVEGNYHSARGGSFKRAVSGIT